MKGVLSALILILLLNNISSLIIDASEGININFIDQNCIIQNDKDLYCNVLLSLSTDQKTQNFSFSFSNVNFEKQNFDLESARLYAYLGSSSDYLNFNLTSDKNQTINKTLNSYGELEMDFNLENLNKGALLFFNYTMKDFISKDPLYNTIFFNLYSNPSSLLENASRVTSSIILPKNSVIDSASLYNFKIMAILNDGRRVVSSDEKGHSVIVYRDWNKEQEEKNKRDISIIFISLGFSIFFSLILSRKNQTKRTKNLWLISSFILLLISFMLFYNLGGYWNILLITLFPLLILSMGLAKSSDELDLNSASIQRDFNIIIKLIYANKFKTFLLIISSIVLVLSYIYLDLFFTFVFLLAISFAIFLRPKRPTR